MVFASPFVDTLGDTAMEKLLSKQKEVPKTDFEKGKFSSVPLEIHDTEKKTHNWKVFVSSLDGRWQTKETLLIQSQGQTILYFLAENIATQAEFYATLEVGKNSILLAIRNKEEVKSQEIYIGEDETILLRCAFPEPLCFSILCDFLNALLQHENFKAYLRTHLKRLRTSKHKVNPLNFSFVLGEMVDKFGQLSIPSEQNIDKQNHHPNSIDEFFLRKDIENLKHARIVSMKYYQRNLQEKKAVSRLNFLSSILDRLDSKKKNLILLHDLLVFVIKTEEDEVFYFVTELFDEKYHHSIDVRLSYIEKQKDFQIKLTGSHSFKRRLKFSFLLNLISRMRRKYSFRTWNSQHYARFMWRLFTSMSLEEQPKKKTFVDLFKSK